MKSLFLTEDMQIHLRKLISIHSPCSQKQIRKRKQKTILRDGLWHEYYKHS